MFTSTVDTINANGGQAGLHPAVYQHHLVVTIAKDLVKRGCPDGIDALTDAAKADLEKKFEKPARESSLAEYLACLFLLLADDRFKPLKREMDNNFHLLSEQGKYPLNILAAKRLMTDFSPLVVPRPARERVPATDVAFVQQGNEPYGDCCACGRKHPGGYKECRRITHVARKRLSKLVKAGLFEEKSDNEVEKKVKKRASRRSPKKAGATFAAIDDVSESESEDEKSERLALPTYEELLRQQGIIQLNVGTQKAWDGNTISKFGFGCLNVGRAQASPGHNGVVLAGAGYELMGSPNE